MQIHTIRSTDGTHLHVREYGDAETPEILFIHGWSQHHLCWRKQIESSLQDRFRIIAMDLRGHGQSDAPPQKESYTTGSFWAGDLRSIIDQLSLSNPILVGWSYGGLAISDYLREFGDDDIGGINFVCAAVGIGPDWFGSHIGPSFLNHAPSACSDDQEVALEAIRLFLEACFAHPIPPEDKELAMGWNMLVPPWVRANLIDRAEDFTPELTKVRKPVLISYGEKDTVVLPKMAEKIKSCIGHSHQSIYEHAAHAPFIEDANRFNLELSNFANLALENRQH